MSQGPEIDLTSLESVTSRLEEVLRDYAKEPENPYILDSVIKRFELSYIVSVRLMQRYLEDYAATPPDTGATFRDIIEMAIEYGLTQASGADWIEYRKARNQTAHTYREEVARELVGEASSFLPVTHFLLESLRRKVQDESKS